VNPRDAAATLRMLHPYDQLWQDSAVQANKRVRLLTPTPPACSITQKGNVIPLESLAAIKGPIRLKLASPETATASSPAAAAAAGAESAGGSSSGVGRGGRGRGGHGVAQSSGGRLGARDLSSGGRGEATGSSPHVAHGKRR
jgi:hypothetical protein